MPKWIRYPLIGMILLLFSIVIIGMIVLGLVILKENIIAGLLMITTGIVLLILSIIKFRKKYLEKSFKDRKNE